MFYVQKRMEIAGAHSLRLSYPSKCANLHGHNWIVTVFCKAQKLDDNGMVLDFTKIKEAVQNRLDHRNLNEVFDFNPTAENIAKWIADNTAYCYKVSVQESEGNIATYERDGD